MTNDSVTWHFVVCSQQIDCWMMDMMHMADWLLRKWFQVWLFCWTIEVRWWSPMTSFFRWADITNHIVLGCFSYGSYGIWNINHGSHCKIWPFSGSTCGMFRSTSGGLEALPQILQCIARRLFPAWQAWKLPTLGPLGFPPKMILTNTYIM
jgi:hypothetical protein